MFSYHRLWLRTTILLWLWGGVEWKWDLTSFDPAFCRFFANTSKKCTKKNPALKQCRWCWCGGEAIRFLRRIFAYGSEHRVRNVVNFFKFVGREGKNFQPLNKYMKRNWTNVVRPYRFNGSFQLKLILFKGWKHFIRNHPYNKLYWSEVT